MINTIRTLIHKDKIKYILILNKKTIILYSIVLLKITILFKILHLLKAINVK